MARTKSMNPAVKFFFIFVIMAVVFGGGYVAWQYKDSIIPKGNSQGAIRTEPIRVAGGGTIEPINICVVTWGGYAAGQYFNGGLAASENSRYFREYGILVNFIVNDDTKASRANFLNGGCDLHWTTVDSFPIEATSMASVSPTLYWQSDWSRGGDAAVGVQGIRSFNDLRGRSVALALDTPSGSYLLRGLEAAGMRIQEITVKQVSTALDAAAAFKAGDADAAVIWSPDDEDCVNSIPGASRISTTREAKFIIADGFYAKAAWAQSHPRELESIIEGWMIGAAEINSDPRAKAEATRILTQIPGVDQGFAELMINNVRLTTLGDNLNFFGIDTSYRGVTGARLFAETGRLFQQNTTLIEGRLPAWNQIADDSFLRRVQQRLSGPTHVAEGGVSFEAPTRADATAEAFSSKALSVTFPTGSSTLSGNARQLIDIGFAPTAHSFAGSRIRIEGNTDVTGPKDVNVRLSRQRAQAVANYLSSEHGFDPNRFVIVGNGPDKPVCQSDTPDCYEQNRRTDFEVLR